MKFLTALSIAVLTISGMFANREYRQFAQTKPDKEAAVEQAEISDFEKAVQIIKKYEGLHQPKHYPLVGYGHRVLPGEKFNRNKAMSEKEAEALLRKDLQKNCAVFRSYGADSLILGVLAYNIGSGATLRSSVAKKLKAGNRDIRESYIAHSRYRGKVHSQIQRRRIEEFETLFIKDSSAKVDKKPLEKLELSAPVTTHNSGNALSALLWRTSQNNSFLSFFSPWGTGKFISSLSNKFLSCISESHHLFSL